MNASLISKIVLWLLVIGSFGCLVYFFAAESWTTEMLDKFNEGKPELEQLNEKVVGTSTFMDGLLYWIYGVFGVAVAALVLFGIYNIAINFKGAIGGIIGVLLLVGLLAGCYFASSATGFERMVNNELEVFSENEMKMIDMWCYSIYALIGAVALLIVGFSALRATKILK